jgi:hypothetical protein
MQNIHIKGYVNSPSYSSATFLFSYKNTDFTINYGNKEPYLNDRFPCHKEYQNKQGERVKHITNYVQIILPLSIILRLDVLTQTITFSSAFEADLDVLLPFLS